MDYDLSCKLFYVEIFKLYLINNDRLIILNTLTQIRARTVENCGSYMCLIGNGRRFYVPEARESYL